MSALKPCPFCGGESFVRRRGNGLIGEWLGQVVCMSCGAKGPETDTICDEGEAIAAWNERPIERELLEALEAAHDFLCENGFVWTAKEICEAVIEKARGETE